MRKIISVFLLSLACLANGAEPDKSVLPKIAVTDLAYKLELRQFFNYTAYSHRSGSNVRNSDQYQDGYGNHSQSSNDNYSSRSETNYSNTPGLFIYIERGELRKFTSDVKGEILKSKKFKLTQAKPFTAQNPSEEIYDVINRIEEGYYPGADYVLFGTFNTVDWREESNPIQSTDSKTNTLGLEIVAEFSLINTKTLEVRSAFSAIGEGSDMKLVKGNAKLVPSKSKVISQASKSLGSDVVRQLLEQFEITESNAEAAPQNEQNTEDVKVYN